MFLSDSKSWVVFTPNIVIDADVGCLWTLEINYGALCAMVTDRIRLVEFLLQRSKGKLYLIQVLQEMIAEGEYKPTNLPIIEAVFDRLNATFAADSEPHNQKVGGKTSFPPRVLVDQSDIHWQVREHLVCGFRLIQIILLLAGPAEDQRPGTLWKSDDGVPELVDQARHCRPA